MTSQENSYRHLPESFGWAFATGAVLNTSFAAAEVIFWLAAKFARALAGFIEHMLNFQMNIAGHLKVLTTVFVLMLVLSGSSFGASGTLLCFGKNGHVAVEVVDACNGSSLGSQAAEREREVCKTCEDVQFLRNQACTRNISQPQTYPLISLFQTALFMSSNEDTIKHVNPSDCLHHKTLASLHSVVLLI